MKLTRRCRAVLGLACTPPWTVNAGLVAGDRLTLIVDTGFGAAAALTLLGYAEALRPSNRIAAVVTEPHTDHMLGIATLRDRGVEVYGHAAVARGPEALEDEIAALATGVADPLRRSEARLAFAGTRVAGPSRPLSAETAIDLGSATAEIMFTPGHTPANLSVHVADQRVLYTGDCVVDGYVPNLEAGGPEDWRTWLASLDRIATLRLDWLVPGHGMPLSGAAVPQGIDRVRRALDRALETGCPPTGPRARAERV